MPEIIWKQWIHPKEIYRLEYPAHWDQRTQEEGLMCGFGPYDRNDVALWVGILPITLDVANMKQDIPTAMRKLLESQDALDPRPDPTLKHQGAKGGNQNSGGGGHLWAIAHDDVVLVCSSSVAAGERDEWNPLFERIMSSLQITREEELQDLRFGLAIAAKLREKAPDEEFHYERSRVVGKSQHFFLGNVLAKLRQSPERQEAIIDHYVTSVMETVRMDRSVLMGRDWNDVEHDVYPMLKPKEYVDEYSPGRHVMHREWLGDVVLAYVLKRDKAVRFILEDDLKRWGKTYDEFHAACLANVAKLPWPPVQVGKPAGGGKVAFIDVNDMLAASRLLHPGLFEAFSTLLGTPFHAGIPSRDLMVLFSDKKHLRRDMSRVLREDWLTSSYALSPDLFLVTRDGVSLPESTDPFQKTSRKDA